MFKRVVGIGALLLGMTAGAATASWAFIIPDAVRYGDSEPFAPDSYTIETFNCGTIEANIGYSDFSYVLDDPDGYVFVNTEIFPYYSNVFKTIIASDDYDLYGYEGVFVTTRYGGETYSVEGAMMVTARPDGTYHSQVTLNANPFVFPDDGVSSGSENVPEPTTGALMLVGLAGLCLRRKRQAA